MKARLENPASQAERLATYLDRLSRVAGHADRIAPMQSYTKGLFLPIERKSVEPMAARLAPASVRQMHQSLHHIVAEAAWSDGASGSSPACPVARSTAGSRPPNGCLSWESRCHRRSGLRSACRWPQ